MVASAPTGFGPALLGGLAELGPVPPFTGDLTLELGISVWLRRSGTSLVEARERLFEVRRAILETSGLDPATEPVPLVGRTPRSDVITLVDYLGGLLRRAAAAAGCSVQTAARLTIAALPAREDEALGA
jgi:hypothetical protein